MPISEYRTGMGTRSGPPEDRQRGSVTAEFTLALPGVVLTLLLVLGLAFHGAAAVAVEEGARAGARELARGTSEETARSIATESAGSGSDVTVSLQPPYAIVTVKRPVTVLGTFSLPYEHTAQAHARTEHLP